MTREEAINLLTDMDSDKYTAREAVALTMAIKALEQANALDKARAEIVHLHDWAFSREEILRIIDKYKAESEEV